MTDHANLTVSELDRVATALDYEIQRLMELRRYHPRLIFKSDITEAERLRDAFRAAHEEADANLKAASLSSLGLTPPPREGQ